ncbi:hypothetical protein CPB84DRAFT_1771623 [Gymnopilus junonius]|uniref:Uncharacterized protein n=1 Tax=Gymnopilus junonius TaxID=109634 RepID=A0A9P5NT35_GYMJU|nr:hypothetical protein CPB84DRAFT_1771623 [Gymnopilus junonius]
MVRLVPKLPSPSRRKLIRLQSVLERAAGLANPSQLGEPRDRLALLLSQSKITRYKRPGLLDFEIELARKKWESNQRRAQARRLAKARNVIEDRSEELGNYLEPSSLDISCDSDAAISRVSTSRSTVCVEVPMTSRTDSCKELHGTVISPAGIPSSPKSFGLPSLMSAMDLSSHKSLNSGLFAIDDQDSTLLESSYTFSFCDATKGATIETSLDTSEVHSFPFISSVLQKEFKITEPSRTSTIPEPLRMSIKAIQPALAFCPPLTLRFFANVTRASSKSSLSSEPLDFSKFSGNTFPVVRISEVAPLLIFPARQPYSNEHGLEIGGPLNFLGYSLSSGRLLPCASYAPPSGGVGTLDASLEESGRAWHNFSLPTDDTDFADVDDLFTSVPPRRAKRAIYRLN